MLLHLRLLLNVVNASLQDPQRPILASPFHVASLHSYLCSRDGLARLGLDTSGNLKLVRGRVDPCPGTLG